MSTVVPLCAPGPLTGSRLRVVGFLRRLLGSAPTTPSTGGQGGDDGWVCGSCRSINRPGTDRCYSCRQSRAAPTPPRETPAWRQLALQQLSGELLPCGREGTLGHRHLARVVSAENLIADQDNPPLDINIPLGLPGGTSPWSELWTFDRCGDLVSYVVSYAPAPTGGMKITVREPGNL